MDYTLDMAIGSAHREAMAASRNEGCAVVIEVEQPNGKWKRHHYFLASAQSDLDTLSSRKAHDSAA